MNGKLIFVSIVSALAIASSPPALSAVLFQWNLQCIEQYDLVQRNGRTERVDIPCSPVPETARIFSAPFLGVNPYTGEAISSQEGELRIELLGPMQWRFNRNLGYWSDLKSDWTFNIYSAASYHGYTWSTWRAQIADRVNPVELSRVEPAQGIDVTAGNVRYRAEWGAYIADAIPIAEPSSIALVITAAFLGTVLSRRDALSTSGGR